MSKLVAVCLLGLITSAWGQDASVTAITQAFATGRGTAEAFSEAAALGSAGGTIIAEALSTTVVENGGDATVVASALSDAIAQSNGCKNNNILYKRGCPAEDAFAQAIAEAFATTGPLRMAASQAVAEAVANAGGSCNTVASVLASAYAIAEGNGQAVAFAEAAAEAGVESCLPSFASSVATATSYSGGGVLNAASGQASAQGLTTAAGSAQGIVPTSATTQASQAIGVAISSGDFSRMSETIETADGTEVATAILAAQANGNKDMLAEFIISVGSSDASSQSNQVVQQIVSGLDVVFERQGCDPVVSILRDVDKLAVEGTNLKSLAYSLVENEHLANCIEAAAVPWVPPQGMCDAAPIPCPHFQKQLRYISHQSGKKCIVEYVCAYHGYSAKWRCNRYCLQ